jgi:hypothetical protein
MCQGAFERLCTASVSCNVRKVARLLAQALSRKIALADRRDDKAHCLYNSRKQPLANASRLDTIPSGGKSAAA